MASSSVALQDIFERLPVPSLRSSDAELGRVLVITGDCIFQAKCLHLLSNFPNVFCFLPPFPPADNYFMKDLHQYSVNKIII